MIEYYHEDIIKKHDIEYWRFKKLLKSRMDISSFSEFNYLVSKLKYKGEIVLFSRAIFIGSLLRFPKLILVKEPQPTPENYYQEKIEEFFVKKYGDKAILFYKKLKGERDGNECNRVYKEKKQNNS